MNEFIYTATNIVGIVQNNLKQSKTVGGEFKLAGKHDLTYRTCNLCTELTSAVEM